MLHLNISHATTCRSGADATGIHMAACMAPLRSASHNVQLMPAGAFRARDGRPEGLSHWVLNDEIAARLIAQAATRKTPFVIDYEHQTLSADTGGHPAPAAAWFTTLEWREGDGLYATDVKWTPRATSYIEQDEYRYLSPVFSYDHSTGEVRELLMAAITNNPAIDGIADLAAARRLVRAPVSPSPLLELAALQQTVASLQSNLEYRAAREAGLTEEERIVCHHLGINEDEFQTFKHASV